MTNESFDLYIIFVFLPLFLATIDPFFIHSIRFYASMSYHPCVCVLLDKNKKEKKVQQLHFPSDNKQSIDFWTKREIFWSVAKEKSNNSLLSMSSFHFQIECFNEFKEWNDRMKRKIENRIMWKSNFCLFVYNEKWNRIENPDWNLLSHTQQLTFYLTELSFLCSFFFRYLVALPHRWAIHVPFLSFEQNQ